MRKCLFILAILLIAEKAPAQYNEVIKNKIIDAKAVVNAETLTYYGLDFSFLKYVRPKMALEDDVLRKYLGAWFEFYQKEIPPRSFLFRWLGFKHYNFDSSSAQSRIDSVARDWVVVTTPEIEIEEIAETIKSYSLKGDTGLGFVIHPVEFNHIEENAKCYFTFFDIATRDILWIAETTGNINGNGTSQWYGYAMVECTRNYIDQVYKKNIKK
jgi:hypothetical protein